MFAQIYQSFIKCPFLTTGRKDCFHMLVARLERADQTEQFLVGHLLDGNRDGPAL